MGDVVVGIHQPNFFPWFGFFLKIARSDKFVFLDDAQTQKKGGSYLNRTKININGESKADISCFLKALGNINLLLASNLHS